MIKNLELQQHCGQLVEVPDDLVRVRRLQTGRVLLKDIHRVPNASYELAHPADAASNRRKVPGYWRVLTITLVKLPHKRHS